MGKGQAAILLIIVGLVVLFLFLSPQMFRPGQPTAPIVYKNDIITLENFEISNLKPIKGSKLTISFDLLNNGDKTVDTVIIDFGSTTNPGNIEIIECEEGVEKTEGLLKRIVSILPFVSEVERLCVFEKIESLDTRKVIAEYTAPEPFSATIKVKVTYPYNGSREALVPIIDDKTVKTPPKQFVQSQPSFGPFAVDIIPPTKGWAIGEQPFEMAFKLRFVGSTAVGIPAGPLNQLKLEKGKIKVTLQEGLKVVSCISQLAGKTGDTVITNDKEIVVNKEYSCNLQATHANGQFGYKLGIVKVDFNYTYIFERSQTITIRPAP